MLDKEIARIASGLYNPLFATKHSIRESISYAYDIAKGSDNPAAVTTALHVVLNTLAQELETLSKTTQYDINHNQESREG